MPVTQITLLPGYDEDVRTRLVNHVSRAVRSVIAAPPAGVTTVIFEAATYQRDGRVFSSGNGAHPPAATCVMNFLAAMQSRELDAAQAFLADNFEMTFPGGNRMHALTDLVAWAKSRYERVEKIYEGIDESWADAGTVVYARGTLSGIWLDGCPFEGIRFIDRFEIQDGLIVKQDVWNDMGEYKLEHC